MAYLIVIWEYESEICSKVHLSARHRDGGRAAGRPLCVVLVSAEDMFVLLVVSWALLCVPALIRVLGWRVSVCLLSPMVPGDLMVGSLQSIVPS